MAKIANDIRPKILLVDDRPDNLLALETLLQPLEAELIRATSGNEAIALTLEHDFALVLLDVQMPEMDGFEVAEILHDTEKTAYLPIIFVSAIYTDDIYRVKGVESGAVDFLVKPIIPALLLGKVRIFLELYENRKKLLQQSFQGIVEQVSDGVMVVSRDGTIQQVNPAAAELLGEPVEKLVGSIYEQKLAPGTLQEIVLNGRNHQRRHVELNVSTMSWHGEPVFIVSMRDVTERLQAKKELEIIINDLNTKNAELESFNYTVSHDLKSPLITIGGFSGLLKHSLGDNMSEDVRTYVSEINGAAAKMILLLNHLLALSRVGQADTAFTTVDLNDLFAEVSHEMEAVIQQRGVELQIEKTLPQVQGDAILLRQVVQNLLENALRYMGEQAHPVINIGVAETAHGRALYVQDNGQGIAPEYLDQVFGLFKRLSAKTEGTGVGLTIVRKIVRFHHGEIWAESAGEGKGATFWVRLPIAE
jgi:signal transduction histidine kinase